MINVERYNIIYVYIATYTRTYSTLFTCSLELSPQ